MTATDTSTPSVGQADALLFELLATPEGRADPYPRYAQLRENWPVHKLVVDAPGSSGGTWVLTRFDHCQAVLRHQLRQGLRRHATSVGPVRRGAGRPAGVQQ